MTPSAYKRVERPLSSHERRFVYDYTALIETAKRGDAVVVPLNGRPAQNVRASLYKMLRSKGYRFHGAVTKDGKGLACWVGPLKEKEKKA